MDLWFLESTFLLAVAQIVMIDILLGGDNAVVIALAAVACPRRSAARVFSGAWSAPSACVSC